MGRAGRLGTAAALGFLLCAAGPGCAPRRTGNPPLRIAIDTGPHTLDPHLQNDVSTQSVLSNLYDALVCFDAEMRLQPALAERWESPDDLTWRFTLREAYFHDGRRLTAADVVFSLERAWHHPESKLSGYLTALAEVTASDDRTVVVRTSRPSPILLNKLTVVAIVPRGSPETIHTPVGTGAYRFGRRDAGQVDLVAFEKHWRGQASEHDVRFLIVPQAARQTEMLLAGDVDIVPAMAGDDAARVEASACCSVKWALGLQVFTLGLRTDRPPFSDLRVRRALSLALDRTGLLRRARRGRGRPSGQLINPSVFGYAPELLPEERDLSAAWRLLAEAGFADGLEPSLEHASLAASDAGAIAAQLADAGFRVKLVERSWEELYGRLVAGKPDFFLLGFLCDTGDATDVFDSVLHSKDLARGLGAHNFMGYASPEFDALVERSAGTRQVAERLKLLREAMGVAMHDLPLVPLWVSEVSFGMRADVDAPPRMDRKLVAYAVRRR